MRWRLPSLTLLALLVSGIAARGESAEPVVRLRENLGRRPYLAPSWIRLDAGGTTVTIHGHVPEERLARLVELVVRNEPGVLRVRNELELEPSLARWRPTTHDRRLQTIANVRRLLADTPELEPYETLGASLDRNTFILHGSVGRIEDRDLALRLVRTYPGVRHVENRIVVREDAPRRAVGGPRTEGESDLLHAIAVAIRDEPGLRGLISLDLGLRARDVVLRGVATSLVAHDLAFELARATLRVARDERERAQRDRGPLTRFLREHGTSHEGVPGPLPAPLPEFEPLPERVVSLTLVALETPRAAPAAHGRTGSEK